MSTAKWAVYRAVSVSISVGFAWLFVHTLDFTWDQALLIAILLELTKPKRA